MVIQEPLILLMERQLVGCWKDQVPESLDRQRRNPHKRKNQCRLHVKNTIFIGLDKSGYQVNIFSYFSMKTYVVGTH